VVVSDVEGIILQVSPSITAALGYQPAELIGTRGLKLRHHDDKVRSDAVGAELMADPTHDVTPVVLRVPHRDGSERQLEVTISYLPAEGDDGCFVFRAVEVTGVYELVDADAGETPDSLTGLPGHRLLVDHVEEALRRTRATEREVVAVLVDIDAFNVVNNSCGYARGDVALGAVARRLRRAVGPSDLVARLGDDRFIVVSEQTTGGHEAHELATRLSRAASAPIAMPGGLELWLTVTIGTSFGSEEGNDVAGRLVRSAELAMHQARRLRAG
jgi:diguanylate cyclase (GGDEF)-like protein/PAS domain S-box-containing protein